jgi:hypothetical protein
MLGFIGRLLKWKPSRSYIDNRGLFHFRCKGSPSFNIDVYEAERNLRKFGNGDAWADAITVLRMAALAVASGSPKMIEEGEKQKQQAFCDLVTLARQAFGLDPVIGGKGFTDTEAFVAVTDYIVAVAALGAEFLPLPKSLARPAVSP